MKNLMNNHSKHQGENNTGAVILYIITLTAVLYVTAVSCPEILSVPALIAVMLLAAGVHFIGCLITGVCFDRFRDGGFQKEYMVIIKRYQESGNGEALYTELKNMQKHPRTVNSRNAYYLSLSTAAIETGNRKEAMHYIGLIQIQSEKMQNIVNKQLELCSSIPSSDVHECCINKKTQETT